jgi:Rod binding domain-containing protein
MDISALSVNTLPAPSKEEMKLQEACDGVEGLFVRVLIKEGMKSMLENAEGHSASALGYALEQTADEIARTGDLGISDHIYDQLSANL